MFWISKIVQTGSIWFLGPSLLTVGVELSNREILQKACPKLRKRDLRRWLVKQAFLLIL